MDKELFVYRLSLLGNKGLTPTFDFMEGSFNFKINLINSIEDFKKHNFNFLMIDFHEHGPDQKESALNVLNKDHINLINNDVVKLIIDFCYEGTVIHEWFVCMHRIIKKKNIKSSNIYFLCNDQVLDFNYEVWSERFNVSKVNIVKLNFHLHYPNSWFRELDLSKLNFKLDEMRPKKFVCINGVLKVFRTLLVIELFKNNLDNEGYISLVGNYGQELDKELTLYGFPFDAECSGDVRFDLYTNDIKTYYKNNIYPKLPIIAEFEKNIPQLKYIADFYKDGVGDQDSWDYSYSSPYLTASYNHEFYTNSYFSILTETAYNWDTSMILQNSIYPSEKIWKPIFGMHPFILVANFGFLDYLKRIGFETFPEFFDESYDKVEDSIERFHIVINEIKKVCSLSNKELHDKYLSVFDKLQHNRNKLMEMVKPHNIANFRAGNLFDIFKT